MKMPVARLIPPLATTREIADPLFLLFPCRQFDTVRKVCCMRSSSENAAARLRAGFFHVRCNRETVSTGGR